MGLQSRWPVHHQQRQPKSLAEPSGEGHRQHDRRRSAAADVAPYSARPFAASPSWAASGRILLSGTLRDGADIAMAMGGMAHQRSRQQNMQSAVKARPNRSLPFYPAPNSAGSQTTHYR